MVYRKSLVVYFKDKNFINTLDKKNLHIYYISSKGKYCIIYLDQDKKKEFIDKMKSNYLVNSIEESLVPYQKYQFENKN